jgi:hypothetical protein
MIVAHRRWAMGGLIAPDVNFGMVAVGASLS